MLYNNKTQEGSIANNVNTMSCYKWRIKGRWL